MRLSMMSLLLLLFLAACAPVAATTPMETVQPVQQIEAVQRAEEDLAQKLDVAIETIQVVKVQDAEWQDTCLGLGKEDEGCALVVTTGFQVTLEAQGAQYIYRTDDTGSDVRLEQITE
ncbi:MAG: hypothetical protein PVG14_02390 [Anaerolineales bacterium]